MGTRQQRQDPPLRPIVQLAGEMVDADLEMSCYKAREAIARLGLPRSTFYSLVRSGRIPTRTMILRKQSLYPKWFIDRLAGDEARLRGSWLNGIRQLTFSKPTEADLHSLLDPEFNRGSEPHSRPNDEDPQQRYYFERAGFVWRIRSLYPQTEDAFFVLKAIDTPEVLGGIAMSVLTPEALNRILRYDVDIRKGLPVTRYLTSSDYVPWASLKNTSIDVFVFDIFTRASSREHHRGALLLRHVLNYFEALLDRGVVVRSLYMMASDVDTVEEKVADRLGFKPCWTDPFGRPIPKRETMLPFARRVFGARSSSHLIRTYQRREHAMQRRQRRHAFGGVQQ